MLLGRLAPEEVALEAEVAVVENVAEGCRDGTLSTLACWQKKQQTKNTGHRELERAAECWQSRAKAVCCSPPHGCGDERQNNFPPLILL